MIHKILFLAGLIFLGIGTVGAARQRSGSIRMILLSIAYFVGSAVAASSKIKGWLG